MASPLSRRQFVKTAAAAAAVAPAVVASGGEPAGGRVRLGLIGCGGRGRQLLRVFGQYADVDVPVISALPDRPSYRMIDPDADRCTLAWRSSR